MRSIISIVLALGLASIPLAASAMEDTDTMAKPKAKVTNTSKARAERAASTAAEPAAELARGDVLEADEATKGGNESGEVVGNAGELAAQGAARGVLGEVNAVDDDDDSSKLVELVRVRAIPKQGFCRAGMRFASLVRSKVPRSMLTDEQFAALLGEPKLEVELHHGDGSVTNWTKLRADRDKMLAAISRRSPVG